MKGLCCLRGFFKVTMDRQHWKANSTSHLLSPHLPFACLLRQLVSQTLSLLCGIYWKHTNFSGKCGHTDQLLYV